MPSITVSKDVAASADAVWGLLADFADVRWIPVIDDLEVEGDGPGMSRKIRGSTDGEPTVETLLWVRPEQRQISYRITNNPLPVRRFEAVVSVTGSGADGCRVEWEVDYEPSADDVSARESIELVYGMMADWLAAAAVNTTA
jgi:carbon monoxide dehydrogenase subunit G